MKCFYHTDIDGICSAAIVKKWHDQYENCCDDDEYIPIDYKDEFPFESIINDEKVVIVDFSLQNVGDFEELLGITDYVIWIDHHKSAIEKHANMNHLNGIREVGKAGCELTWEFFFPRKVMPLAVEYAGRYDVWDFSEHGEKLHVFQAGIRLREHMPVDDIWKYLLDSSDNEINDIILNEGRIALKYKNNLNRSLIEKLSFTTEFEGYKAICINQGIANSQIFNSVGGDYGLMMPFVFDGKKWRVSIFTHNKNIDCSQIAKRYGGGGHQGAAGFICSELPFELREVK